MDVRDLHATIDARVWATEFVKTHREHDIATDVATMEGWFANAMCAARDFDLRQRRQSGEADLAARYESLRKVIDGGSESMTHEDALEACILAFDREGTHDAELSRLIIKREMKAEEAP